MTFVKGQSGNPSGRPKGARDKLNRKVDEKLAELGCDPIEGMARIALEAERKGDLPLAARCYSELAQYVAPKRRSFDVTAVAPTVEVGPSIAATFLGNIPPTVDLPPPALEVIDAEGGPALPEGDE